MMMIQATSFSLAIYLLIFAVFAIFKALGDKAKKNGASSTNQKDGQQPQHKAPSELPETWKDLFPHEVEMSKPEPVATKKPSTPLKDVKRAFDMKKQATERKRTVSSKVFIEDASEEGKRALNINIPQNNTTEINDDEDYTFHNIEEVRKAIIWSEIINPKYK